MKNLYLGRKRNGDYELGRYLSAWHKEYGFAVSVTKSFIKGFCGPVFQRITGVRLRKGQVRKIKSITIKLEK